MKPHNKKQQLDLKTKMAPQRSTRSTRSNAHLARPAYDSPKKRATLPRIKTDKARVTRPTTRSSKASSVEIDADLESVESGDDAADQDENTDSVEQPEVIAPSSDSRVSTQSQLPEATLDTWTGFKNEDHTDETMNDDQVSEAGSVSSSIAEEDLNVSDDDNYDDIDQISNASESSDAFEKEVEKEILEAGEDAIDWNDENTYGFDGQASQYSLSIDFDSLLSPFDENDVFGLGARIAAARASDEYSPKKVLFDSGPDQVIYPDSTRSDSSGSSKDGESSGSDHGSLRSFVNQDVSEAPGQSDVAEEDVTDDEDPPNSSAASPSVTRSRASSHSNRRANNTRVITYDTPRKRAAMPMRRRIPVEPSKVVAFTSGSVYGRRFRVKRRHNHYFKWVQISTSPCSTAPNSPTMIDLQSALGQGNTRTGAGITDAIHGRLFQQFHCGHDSNSVIDNSILATEFAKMPHLRAMRRPYVSGQSSVFGWMQDYAMMQEEEPHDEALAYIDFDGGMEDDDVEDMNMEEGVFVKAEVHDEDVMELASSIPQIVGPQHSRTGRSEDFGMLRLQDESLQAPPTPTSPDREFLLPVGNASSPKKRRASNMSSRRSASPAMKRSRGEGPDEIAV